MLHRMKMAKISSTRNRRVEPGGDFVVRRGGFRAGPVGHLQDERREAWGVFLGKLNFWWTVTLFVMVVPVLFMAGPLSMPEALWTFCLWATLLTLVLVHVLRGISNHLTMREEEWSYRALSLFWSGWGGIMCILFVVWIGKSFAL